MTSRALLPVVTLFLAATVAPKPGGNGNAMVAPDSMESVVKRTFTTYGFRLQSGKTLPEMTLAFETYGRLAPDGRNAILVTHGGTGGQHMARKYWPTDRAPGGMGHADRPRQGDRHEQVLRGLQQRARVVVWVDRPASINPATGKRTGRTSPRSRCTTS